MNSKISVETSPNKYGNDLRGNKIKMNLEFIDTDIWDMIRLR